VTHRVDRLARHRSGSTRASTKLAALASQDPHQIWLGDGPLPEEFAGYRRRGGATTRDWEHRFWTEENLLPDLRRPEVYERLRVPRRAVGHPQARAALALRRGLRRHRLRMPAAARPVDRGPRLLHRTLKPNGWVNNAFIGAVPEHPIVDRALDELRRASSTATTSTERGLGSSTPLLREYPKRRASPQSSLPDEPGASWPDAVRRTMLAAKLEDIDQLPECGRPANGATSAAGQIRDARARGEALRAEGGWARRRRPQRDGAASGAASPARRTRRTSSRVEDGVEKTTSMPCSEHNGRLPLRQPAPSGNPWRSSAARSCAQHVHRWSCCSRGW